MMNDKLTASIHIPLWPSLRQQIDDLARAEDVKPATKARMLILDGLAVEKSRTADIERRMAALEEKLDHLAGAVVMDAIVAAMREQDGA